MFYKMDSCEPGDGERQTGLKRQDDHGSEHDFVSVGAACARVLVCPSSAAGKTVH